MGDGFTRTCAWCTFSFMRAVTLNPSSVLLLVTLSPLGLLAQASPRRTPRSETPEAGCFEPPRPVTPLGVARGYLSALGHAAAAESLTAHAFPDSAREVALSQTLEGRLADVFYNLDAARHQYRCAAQVLDPLRGAADSGIRAFARETHGVFDTHATWIRDMIANIKRRARGDSRTTVSKAEQLADLHRRRDVLTQLIGLNSTGLSYILLEPQGDKKMRLALTAAQRDSLVAELHELAAGSGADVPGVASSLIEWLGKEWPTR